MSVYLRMLGNELPCSVLELLGVHPLPLPASEHESLSAAAERSYPDVLYKLGLSHLGRQELGLARKRLAEAAQIKPQFVKARLALAAVCDLLAQHAEAAEQLEAVLELLPESAQEAAFAEPAPREVSRYSILCAAGFCLERCGRWQDGITRYTQALSHNPGDLFADYRLAAIYLAHGQLEDAVRHHEAILEYQPQEQAVRISLAHLNQMLGRHQQAVWEYEKALCLEPDNWDLQMELADQLSRMGSTDEAIDQLRQMVGRQPQFPDLRLRLANLYSDRGEDKAAVDEYDHALSLHPGYLDCRIALARHELRMGRVSTAMENFQAAMAINDQNVEAYVGMAVALQRMGDLTRAKEMLASASKISNNTDIVLAQMGLLEIQASDGEGVTVEPEPATESAEESAVGMRQKIIEQQEQRCESMLQAHPGWTDVRIRHGMLLRMLGRHEQAAEQLKRAATDNPASSEAWIQLGRTLLDRNEATEAIKAFEAAVRMRPEDAELHYRLALMYCGQMEFDLAMEQLEMASAAGNGNPDFQRQVMFAVQNLQMKGRTSPATMADRIVPMARRKSA